MMKTSPEIILDELKKYTDKITPQFMKAVSLLDPEFTNMEIKLRFYVLFIKEKEEISFLPTGTKQAPEGIGAFEGDLIVVVSEKGVFCVLTKDMLKAVIKKHPEIFQRGIGPDFETMGVIIQSKKALEVFNSELLFV
jgi:hypothetical protein